MPSNWPTSDRSEPRGPGRLYVVATPIGNMEDITFRALRVLGEVDLVAAEDTRHTGRLMTRHHIRTPLVSYHEHNETERTPVLIDRLKSGISIALVTDAGTPSVSDPGYRLIRAAVKNGIDTVPVPGVSAAVAALSVSGLPTDAFVFAGFMPRRKAKRRKALAAYASEEKTAIFFESPRRIVRLLEEIAEIVGDRYGVLSREMTKRHETFYRGPVATIAAELKRQSEVKGECTLVLSGCPQTASVDIDDLCPRIEAALKGSDSTVSQIAKQIAAQTGWAKSKVYAKVMQVKKDQDKCKRNINGETDEE